MGAHFEAAISLSPGEEPLRRQGSFHRSRNPDDVCDLECARVRSLFRLLTRGLRFTLVNCPGIRATLPEYLLPSQPYRELHVLKMRS
jgi:hypothetical protein